MKVENDEVRAHHGLVWREEWKTASKYTLGGKAAFAMRLIEALLAGGVDLTSAHNSVSKACDISEVAFREFRRRGWLLDLPDVEDDSQESE